jgi:Domain of unknown function (DUF397)
MASQPNRDSTLVWRKSRVSGADGGCVEVATVESSVLVRDSRNQSEATLEFSPTQWRGFVRRIKDGRMAPG